MGNTFTVTVIHSTYKLLKVFSCFGFCQSPGVCLVQENSTKNVTVIILDSDPKWEGKKKKKSCLTILSNSFPPVTNSSTIKNCVLESITYTKINACIYISHLIWRGRLKGAKNGKFKDKEINYPSNLIHMHHIRVSNHFHH